MFLINRANTVVRRKILTDSPGNSRKKYETRSILNDIFDVIHNKRRRYLWN
jgi:hypothetical protein